MSAGPRGRTAGAAPRRRPPVQDQTKTEHIALDMIYFTTARNTEILSPYLGERRSDGPRVIGRHVALEVAHATALRLAHGAADFGVPTLRLLDPGCNGLQAQHAVAVGVVQHLAQVALDRGVAIKKKELGNGCRRE